MTTHSRLCSILDQNLQICTDIALTELERLARRTMERNGRAVAFRMGKGSALFYDKNGQPFKAAYMQPFYAFLEAYDASLRLRDCELAIEGHDGELVKEM